MLNTIKQFILSMLWRLPDPIHYYFIDNHDRAIVNWKDGDGNTGYKLVYWSDPKWGGVNG